MNIQEVIKNTKEVIETTTINKEVYLETEKTLIGALSSLLKGAEISHSIYGIGIVESVNDSVENLDHIALSINFDSAIKRIGILSMMSDTFSKIWVTVKCVDTDIADTCLEIFIVHNSLTKAYKEFEASARQAAIEAEKKAQAAKKAEEAFKRQKDRAIAAFDEMVGSPTTIEESNDFYYALGWLANHIGSMTAVLPDYLDSAFEKHFGSETPKTLVDSRAKTSGGYAKQWSWEFKCTIKKLKETVVPTCIQDVTTDFAKGIHNTAFLWDLVSNYGFQFGKKQDIEKIREVVPVQYISSFEAGLIA